MWSCIAGFLQQLAAVCHPERPDLNMAAVLRELSGGQTPTRVICCGHSLGGALATLGIACFTSPDVMRCCALLCNPVLHCACPFTVHGYHCLDLPVLALLRLRPHNFLHPFLWRHVTCSFYHQLLSPQAVNCQCHRQSLDPLDPHVRRIL